MRFEKIKEEVYRNKKWIQKNISFPDKADFEAASGDYEHAIDKYDEPFCQHIFARAIRWIQPLLSFDATRCA